MRADGPQVAAVAENVITHPQGHARPRLRQQIEVIAGLKREGNDRHEPARLLSEGVPVRLAPPPAPPATAAAATPAPATPAAAKPAPSPRRSEANDESNSRAQGAGAGARNCAGRSRRRAELQAPARRHAAILQEAGQNTAGQPLPPVWWNVFNDAKLNELEDQAQVSSEPACRRGEGGAGTRSQASSKRNTFPT